MACRLRTKFYLFTCGTHTDVTLDSMQHLYNVNPYQPDAKNIACHAAQHGINGTRKSGLFKHNAHKLDGISLYAHFLRQYSKRSTIAMYNIIVYTVSIKSQTKHGDVDC